MAVLDPESNFAASNVLGVVANATRLFLSLNFSSSKNPWERGLDAPREVRKPTAEPGGFRFVMRTAPFGRTPATAWRLMRATFTFRDIWSSCSRCCYVGLGPASSLLLASPFSFTLARRFNSYSPGSNDPPRSKATISVRSLSAVKYRTHCFGVSI